MSVVFGLLKMPFWVRKKGQLLFSENGQKDPDKFKNTQVTLE